MLARIPLRSLLLAMLLLPAQLSAVVEVYRFEDPADEERYKALIAELRCLVCQNQNLADSNADLAKDLRRKTYEMIRDGATDAEIVDYMVARYGEFVLYRPPLSSSTALLWLGPFALLLLGVIALVVVMRRQARRAPAAVGDDERARVRELLDADDGEERRS